MTDDISMKALSDKQDQATNADNAFSAGADIVMFCHGSIDARLAFIAACPTLSGQSLERARRAEAFAPAPLLPFDTQAGWARFGELTGLGRNIVYSVSPDPTDKAWA
jgi:beta-N-acetylhexosaminidase